jgi:hypothetical protein
LEHPTVDATDPKASTAVNASDAPDKERMKPPKQRKLVKPKPGQYSEAKKRTSS